MPSGKSASVIRWPRTSGRSVFARTVTEEAIDVPWRMPRFSFLSTTLHVMDAELVINSTSAGVDIALLEDGQLVELHRDRGDVQYAVGDIYVGCVRRLCPI